LDPPLLPEFEEGRDCEVDVLGGAAPVDAAAAPRVRTVLP
jgi:hypothetical protein